jgi:motility quorum-sensing regulator/GCU-specific mRNA interferase toxin
MDKFNPTYNLQTIKNNFKNEQNLNITHTARQNSRKLGINSCDIIQIIQSLQNKNFYKSMTSYHDNRLWQDVYHADYNKIKLYIKFTMDNDDYLLISLKEK